MYVTRCSQCRQEVEVRFIGYDADGHVTADLYRCRPGGHLLQASPSVVTRRPASRSPHPATEP